ncbi:endo-1,4-beta-xylanase [Cadophora sp. MPI-SDFR-AT-0126]|nr:endo-1,4-beta-xylanase [Leotiomycetes sp. MPI-SDFR-AT-0126]
MFFSISLAVLLLGTIHPVLSSTVRINALGDSITGSPGCWRALLWQKLQAAGVINTDFVGTLAGQGCGFTYDGENDGHGGFLATGIVSNNQLPGWLAVSQPDIVMMQLGTNDVWSNLPKATILAAYTTLVSQMRTQNPNVLILVAQITPMSPSGCSTCAQGVIDLNAAIPAWATGISTTASPVSVVDLWTGFSTSLDTGDGVHPNDAGNAVLANDWFQPLSSAIVRVGGPQTGIISSSTLSTRTPSTTIKASTTSTLITKTSSPITSTSPAATGGASSPIYGQCGGQSWNGPFTCAVGSICTYNNAWYSQCIPV